MPGVRWVRLGFLLLAIGLIALGAAWGVFERERRGLVASWGNVVFFQCDLMVVDGRIVPLPSDPLLASESELDLALSAFAEEWLFKQELKRSDWFGWLWGALPRDMRLSGFQRLRSRMPGSQEPLGFDRGYQERVDTSLLPDDYVAQISEQVRAAIEAAPGSLDHVSVEWPLGVGSDELLGALTRPLRVTADDLDDYFDLRAFYRETPSWLLPLVDFLSAIGSFGILGGLACLIRGVPLRRRSRKRAARGACIACGYDMEGLAVCPECGAND